MMEEVEEQKFVCKFCNKHCFSGKSLGGHMRGHLALISAARREKVEGGDGDDHADRGLQENSDISFRVSAEQSNCRLISEKVENRSQESYCLREKSKKSWKALDLRSLRNQRKGNRCKECCKMFPTTRALVGHLRIHSLKLSSQHLCKNCGKGFDSMSAMYGHMKSHSKRSRASSESADGLSDFDISYPKKKRSVMRHRSTQNLSFSGAHVSSSSFDEPSEEEDVAICLMMLSRNVRNWDGFNVIVENIGHPIPTSVDSEVKSFSYLERMDEVARNDFVCDPNEVDATEKQKGKLGSCFLELRNSFSKQNASEFNDVGSAEFVSRSASTDEVFCSEMHVDVPGSELDDSKTKRANESAGVELPKLGIPAVEFDQKDLQLAVPGKPDFDGQDHQLGGDSSDVAAKCDDNVPEILKDRYKCRDCNMRFHSPQALGGHRNRQKILGNCSAPSTWKAAQLSGHNKASTDSGSGEAGMAVAVSESKKSKEHKCHICFKDFSSGQALGGHKRAHYAGVTGNRIKEASVVNREHCSIGNACGVNNTAIAPQLKGPEMMLC